MDSLAPFFGLKRKIREKIGIFFVKKKAGGRCLVCDSRRSNEWFHSPPCTRLAGGFAEVDVSETQQIMYMVGFDVMHTFYQHLLPGWLQRYFGLPSVAASLLGVEWLDGCAVAPSDLIFPVMRVIPMGWSLALHLVQKMHEGVV